MLNNACLLAKIGADTTEHDRNVANILPKISQLPRRRRAPLRRGGPDCRERAEPGDPPELRARRRLNELYVLHLSVLYMS